MNTPVLKDVVNTDTRRVRPKRAPELGRLQPTPLLNGARGESYTGSRWTGRTEQSKVTEMPLAPGGFQLGRMSQTVWTGESLADWKTRQQGYERRVAPRDLSHWG